MLADDVRYINFVARSPSATSEARESEFILNILPLLFTAIGVRTGTIPSESPIAWFFTVDAVE